ncbi:hypothetical protein [Nocardiopsis sp. NPDC006938]|uniref:hypothetical protein n=1 Tax=Nocardiopsis sp. NPDC006938 TaxID=3364337 RepID=UPI0036B653D9
MSDLSPEERRFYADSPTTVLYDIFADTATRLSGKYVALSDHASNPTERDRWWKKVLELKAARRVVDPRDRDALIAHTRRWQAEVQRLQDG